MYAEEGSAQIRNRVDVRAELGVAWPGVQIQSLERQDPVTLREAIIPGDPVCVQARGVHHIAGGDGTSRLPHVRLGPTVASSDGINDDAGAADGPDKRLV